MSRSAGGIFVLLLLGLLSGCGGGGGGNGPSGGGFTGPEPIKVFISAARTTLPANLPGRLPALGSAYTTQVNVVVQNSDGSAVANGTKVQLTEQNVSVGGLSRLDDPATTDIDEFTGCQITSGTEGPPCTLSGTLSVDTASGQATFFFTSFSNPGSTGLVATVTDPNSGQQVSATLDVAVVSGAGTGIPGTIVIQKPIAPLYIKGQNAPDTTTIVINLTDASGLPVADPPVGVNNIRVSLLSAPDGVLLQGTNAAGQPVQTGQIGADQGINVNTLGGVTSVSLSSGTEQGIATVRVTADAADNDVDNGIASPVSEDVQIAISDGQLFSLEFAPADVIVANAVIVEGGVIVCASGTCAAPPTTNGDVGVSNGSYSQVISVLATDRFGNPVVPGTSISFGLIDGPLAPADVSAQNCSGSQFAIRGTTGNPQEGTVSFTDLAGHFLSIGGGARHGDLLLFDTPMGSLPSNPDPFNSEALMSGGRTIDTVATNQDLTVTNTGLAPFNVPFNPLSSGVNGDYGPTTDPGPVVNYIIGRPTGETIQSPQYTDANPPQPRETKGVASTSMTYPIVNVGQPFAIVAQGTRVDHDQNGNPVNKTVGTILQGLFGAPGPGTLTAFPDTIDVQFTCDDLNTDNVCDTPPTPQNEAVTLAIVDALGNPVPRLCITGSVTGNSAILGSEPLFCATDASGRCTVDFTVNPLQPCEPPNPSEGPVTCEDNNQATITWVAGATTATATTGVTSTLTVNVPAPLAVAPASLQLTGAPGATVSAALSVSGGIGPYAVTVTGSGSVNPTSLTAPGDVIYSFQIPTSATSGQTFTASVTVTDSVGGSVVVPVTVTAGAGGAALGVSPGSLNLTGASGALVTGTLAVSGGVAPYTLTLSGSGSLSPTSLTGAGSATYSFTIPASAAPGQTFNATVTVKDSAGASVAVPVLVTVSGSKLSVSPAAANPSGAPNTTVSQTLAISGGVAPYHITITGSGSVTPTTLPAVGSVIYSFLIPANATSAQVFNATVTVTDSSSSSVTVPIQVTVTPAAALSVDPSSAALTGTCGTGVEPQTFTVSGGVPPYTFSNLAGGCAGATLTKNPTTATFSYAIPDCTVPGLFTCSDSFTVTDGASTVVTVPITVNGTP
jgi:hypothetical protein